MPCSVTLGLEKKRYAPSSPALSNASGKLHYGSCASRSISSFNRALSRLSSKLGPATSSASAGISRGSRAIPTFDHAAAHSGMPNRKPLDLHYFQAAVFGHDRVDG